MDPLFAAGIAGFLAFLVGRYLFPKRRPEPRPADGPGGRSAGPDGDQDRPTVQ